MNIERRDFAPHTVRTRWNETQGDKKARVSLVTHFGLHAIKGNRAPYFTITADGYENGRLSFGGCCHDIIAERLPDLRDMIALHLSDIDGIPTHAAANGLYWLAGVVDLGREFHGGNGTPGRSPMDCARGFADMMRIPLVDVTRIAGMVNTKRKAGTDPAHAMRDWVDEQRPRWKREARDAIAKYQLGVFGDIYQTPAELAENIAFVDTHGIAFSAA
jgi:hypothetical protein